MLSINLVESTKAMETATCFVNRLPDELLLVVLEYLHLRDTISVSQVCRRWWRIASHRALVVRKLDDERRVHPYLRQLLITARGAVFPRILDVTRSLHTLIIHKRVPLDTAMFKALQNLPNLVHLDVFAKSRLLPTEVIPVAQRLHTLVINESMPQNVLRDLACSSRLTQLHMYGRSLYYDPRMMTALIASRRLQLTELTLRCNELPDLTFQEIANCQNLVVLRLYTCWLLRAPCAINLTCLPKLRVLHLTGARMLWASQLRFMIEVFPKTLEELCLSGTRFSDEHITSLVRKAPKLRVLELWNTPASNNGLCRLAMKLQHLVEFDVNKVFRCEQVDELAMHPTLVKVRCMQLCSQPPDVLWDLVFDKTRVSKKPAVIPCVRYARGSLRTDGSGFRSGLYYHWSVDHPPLPLLCRNKCRHRMVAPFDDSDDDMSLLGPEVKPPPCQKSRKTRRKSFKDAAFDLISFQDICRSCCSWSPTEGQAKKKKENEEREREEFCQTN